MFDCTRFTHKTYRTSMIRRINKTTVYNQEDILPVVIKSLFLAWVYWRGFRWFYTVWSVCCPMSSDQSYDPFFCQKCSWNYLLLSYCKLWLDSWSFLPGLLCVHLFLLVFSSTLTEICYTEPSFHEVKGVLCNPSVQFKTWGALDSNTTEDFKHVQDSLTPLNFQYSE